MGFWTEIKKEFQLSKFGFRGVQIDRFCHFQATRQQEPSIRFNLEKLKDPEVLEVFLAQVGSRFAALATLDCDIDTLAGNVKEVLVSSAEELLGKQRKCKQPWVTDDILDLCDERRALKKERDWRLPVALYIGYRLVLMFYGAFWLGYISTYHGTPPQSWGAYLTNWTYITLNIYLISHCVLALVLHARRLICSCPADQRARYCCGKQIIETYEAMFLEFGRNEDGYDIIPGSTVTTVGAGDREDYNGVENSAVTLCENVEPGYRQRQTLPIFACFVWVMYSVISAAAMMVTIVFFAFLFPTLSDYPEIGLENLQVHLLNSVIIVVEHCLSAVPFRLLHVIYPLLYGLIYMTFSLIYWTGDHERVLYPDILDWNKPGSTVGYVLLIGFVFIPLLHTFFFVLYKAKLQIFKHFYFGQS